jgi:hypothetical protein
MQPRAHHTAQFTRFARRFVLSLVAVLIAGGQASAADNSVWARSPYKVLVTLAVQSELRPHVRLEEALGDSIAERADGLIAPLWVTELEIASDAPSRRMCLEPRELTWDELPAPVKAFDKVLWLGIQASPFGYNLVCREFDVYTRRWGSIHRQLVPQTTYLAQACFDLLISTFTPLAAITPLANNEGRVQLVFKGSDLLRSTDKDPFVKPGDILQPLLRRTNRSGELMENGVIPVPWTYLTAAANENGHWLANVQSGVRRPFGLQRGRAEQLALGLQNPPGPAKVRFYARRDRTQGLPGYEVFRVAEDGSTELIGGTDDDGAISIPSDEQRAVTMVLLRSEGQMLAKAPVPPGNGPLLEIPIADNIARLRAHSEAQVVREQLIDIVARRAIMMARIRAMLKKDRIDDARKLMAELDALPTSSVFGRSIDVAAKKITATDDPAVQRTIDKLFASTRELLSKFLDRRPIIDLQNEVNAAQRGG